MQALYAGSEMVLQLSNEEFQAEKGKGSFSVYKMTRFK